ncbi:MAG: type II 3-dehydroquinate dehydratase [Rhodospirillaceae bacterium]|nr:MAG: type II 3-dehydroquinate dehydratase [Rhodospirillaceae bacterium]
MSRSILVINGPNLNQLGQREPHIYGHTTLDEIKAATMARGKALGLDVDFRQSNSEAEIIGWIQAARGKTDGLIINGAGLTHTSVAIMDALLAVDQPVIEVHLSNLFRREEFRHHSFISRAATGMICGLGAQGYLIAVDAIAELISKAGKA